MKDAMTGLASTVALLSALMLSACNTIEGAGKDVESAGDKIQNANCTSEEAKTNPNCAK